MAADDQKDIVPMDARPDLGVRGGISIINAAGSTAIVPQNMAELIEFAKLMAKSDFCIRPAFRNNPGACLAISQQALRHGMDPIAYCNKAYITKNSRSGEEQIAIEAQLVHAIVNRNAPLARRLRPIYSGQGPTRVCKILGYLKGEDEPFEYESPELRNIGVQNSPLWKSDPDQQLFYYSSRAWARRHVPEVLLGVYTPDEIEAIDNHYGPGRAKDVTPRPQRDAAPQGDAALPDAAPRPKVEFELLDGDGVVTTYDDPSSAANALYISLRETALGRSALEGLWESNAPLMADLRKNGAGDLADAVLKSYGELLDTVTKRDDDAAEEEKRQKASGNAGGGAPAQEAAQGAATAPKAAEAPQKPQEGAGKAPAAAKVKPAATNAAPEPPKPPAGYKTWDEWAGVTIDLFDACTSLAEHDKALLRTAESRGKYQQVDAKKWMKLEDRIAGVRAELEKGAG